MLKSIVNMIVKTCDIVIKHILILICAYYRESKSYLKSTPIQSPKKNSSKLYQSDIIVMGFI